ncbi:MAG: oxidoreductase [Paludisphaera borealis]|uniref:oxidoreductase n=1 Tax=Paludisphaera borealis TaxID=1387353 RepID=UPI002849CBE4|nr:oxidoreductase [Paludisphaera borealis]MDR3622859.1 oxidoreductase [Paludisphaera borealis]
MVAASGLLCWGATRVCVWYARRPTYRALADYHRGEAEYLKSAVSNEEFLYKQAAHYLPGFLAHPEIDMRRILPDELRSDTFHPFSGPRSEWTAAVDAQGERVRRLKERVAFHARMSEEFRRASESFLAPVPSVGYVDPLPWWVDPEVLRTLKTNPAGGAKSNAAGKAMSPSPSGVPGRSTVYGPSSPD